MSSNKFGPRLTADDRHELIQMRREGATFRDLAQAFGISTAAVGYHLKLAGLTRDWLDPATHNRPDDNEDPALPVLPYDDRKWLGDALCAQVDPEIFFPTKGGSTRKAKAICARCPVQVECLDDALTNNERFGIWGGVTERTRRRLAQATTNTTTTENTQEAS